MSSKRAERRRSCEGKTRFVDQDDALNFKRRRRLAAIHPYRCQFCNHFHLGHKRGTGRKHRRTF